ncbi:MAG: ABC transporter permease [Brevinematales bacterium]
MKRDIIIGLIKKEFTQLFRDIRMRIVLFVPPILMLILFGYAINTDIKNVRMIVHNEDKTTESREFIEKFTGSGYFYVIKYIENLSEVDQFFDKGKADIYIHLERNFAKKLKSGKTATIQLIVDGTDSSRSSMILASVNGILEDSMKDYVKKNLSLLVIKRNLKTIPKLSQNIEVKERILFNPDLSSRNFYLTGMFALLISMITILLTAMSIVKEREVGTIDQLIVSPIKPLELVAGKTLPYVIVGFVDIIIISLISIFWFKIPFRGSFLLLLFSSLEFLITTTAVGVYISTISHTQQQALLSVVLFMIPALLFSGFAFPIDSMPEVIRLITYVNPMRHFIEIVRSIFLKGSGFSDLWQRLLYLFVIGVGLFYLSTKRFARHLE